MVTAYLELPHNKTLQLTQKASFVLCIALRFIFAQNQGRFWAAELSGRVAIIFTGENINE
jgi:hypothetical protein